MSPKPRSAKVLAMINNYTNIGRIKRFRVCTTNAKKYIYTSNVYSEIKQPNPAKITTKQVQKTPKNNYDSLKTLLESAAAPYLTKEVV